MGRPKGSKNRYKTRRKRDAYRGALLKIFPAEIVRQIEQLSLESGFSVMQVTRDMAPEGLACLRDDGYQSIIKFRKRLGKTVHERDLERDGEGSEGPAPEESGESIGPENHVSDRVEESAIPIEARPFDVDERRGFSTEDQENNREDRIPIESSAHGLVNQIVAPLDEAGLELSAPGELPVTDLPI